GTGKVLRLRAGTADGEQVTGYEIYHGVVGVSGGEPFPGGCRAGGGYGTTWHGVFESDGVPRAVPRPVAAGAGPAVQPAHRPVCRGQGPPPRHARRPGGRPPRHRCAAAPRRARPAPRPALRPAGGTMRQLPPDDCAEQLPEASEAPARGAMKQPDEPVILLLSASDTDLMAARASGGPYRLANPARTAADAVPGLLQGAFCVIVRLLGGRRSWPGGLAEVLAGGLPVVVISGEPEPDADLMAASTVPGGVAAQALAYLREGGPGNLAELARFLSDTLLLTGEGFAPPVPLPAHGVHGDRAHRPGRPTVGIVFYRAHAVSGNTAFVDALADAVEARGGNARPVFCASLRSAGPAVYDLL